MKQPISFLRQWLNEDRNCKPLVTNQEIWYWLNSSRDNSKWIVADNPDINTHTS